MKGRGMGKTSTKGGLRHRKDRDTSTRKGRRKGGR
jgi:hypothetical protein